MVKCCKLLNETLRVCSITLLFWLCIHAGSYFAYRVIYGRTSKRILLYEYVFIKLCGSAKMFSKHLECKWYILSTPVCLVIHQIDIDTRSDNEIQVINIHIYSQVDGRTLFRVEKKNPNILFVGQSLRK